jgi:DNA phosphorothioation-associated putative methyltransferase
MIRPRVGKVVNDSTYFHFEALEFVASDIASLAQQAIAIAGNVAIAANVLKVDTKRRLVSLLHYPAFFENAFPPLTESWRISLDDRRISYRTYVESLNPPILHRKELLLPCHHPAQGEWQRLTQQAESLGLFENPSTIGFLNNWLALIESKGYRIEGHTFQPLGNDIPSHEIDEGESQDIDIRRHLTALVRSNFSAPLQTLIRHGFINPGYTFFDYGCGRGNDLASVKLNEIQAAGWDPHFAPEEPILEADVVNLGFVINVIENLDERVNALKRAFSLSRKVLAVSVMLYNNYANNGRPYGDGYLTSKNTFQKYYTQAEVKEFVESVLDAEAIPVAPGILFVFADSNIEQQFLTQRFRTHSLVRRLQRAERIRSERVPKVSRLEHLYQENKSLLDNLWELCLDLGRRPEKSEIPFYSHVLKSFKTLSRAIHAVNTYYDLPQLDKASETRKSDLLVFFALQHFGKRKPYRYLDPRLQQDIKHFFGDYQNAVTEGRLILLKAADPSEIDAACCMASQRGFGWYESSQSLQLHASLVERLPTILRVYVACGLKLYGDIEELDLIKIHVRSGKLTLMSFDDFEGQALPKMMRRIKVDLRTQDFQVFDYIGEFLPPYVYRKSRFINEEFAHYEEQLEVEGVLESLGLLNFEGYGPPVTKFEELLKQNRYVIDRFTVSRSQSIPELDAPCGRYLTYRDLIECGETQARSQISNLPKVPDSYTALHDLAQNILDPVIDYFGMIKLTYGFSSSELTRTIPGRIAPDLDQHAAHERKRNGKYVCERLGAACDFFIEDENMAEVANWLMNTVAYDRLYFYGERQPIHVSYKINPGFSAYEMVTSKHGKRIPRRVDRLSLLT